MSKLSVFNFVTLNGFYKGPDGDISWAKHDDEGNQYSADAMKQENILLFGRATYEMMAGYWPTPMAMESAPEVAAGMNRSEKIVFSHKLKKANWNNTRIIKEDIVAEVKKLKQQGKNMTILGSGSIVTLMAEHDLVDEYQVMVYPIAIGDGTPMFKGMKKELDLKLTGTRTFKNGTQLLFYTPNH
jgi:dihydrofolate reductase